MSSIDNQTYFMVKDKFGYKYLCPVDSVKNRNAITDDEMDSCVEKVVVERYSGNIDVE